MCRCLFQRVLPPAVLPVERNFAGSKRNGGAEDGGNLAVQELVLLIAAGARRRHILALLAGDGDAVPLLVGVCDVPPQVSRLVDLKGDAAGGAGDRKGPNITSDTSDLHKNLRPFKGE